MQINLTVIKGPHKGREFSFAEHDNFIVGRAEFAHFRLPEKDRFFSRVHFMVEVNPPLCRLIDMNSTNGTSVDGRKVKTADLHDGDRIKAGKTVIRVTLHETEEEPRGEILASQLGSFAVGFEHGALSEPAAPPEPVEPPVVVSRRTVIESVPSPPPVLPGADGESCRVCATSLRGATCVGYVPVPSRWSLCPDCRAKIGAQAQPIPGYQIVRELGRGAMGVVSLVLRDADGVLVALKTVQPAMVGTEAQTERFLREARILGQLDHPHIVAFHDVGESDGLLYFAMDFVQGSDVAELQRRHGGPLSIPRAVDLTCQMLSALEYAHAKGFVHRDIKPSNLLVEEKDGHDVVRLTDFGLARTYQTSPLSGLTLQGSIGGTVAFMAPEQITHFREAKPPVDQYAAGATLYKLLTDRAVFDLPRQLEHQLLMILKEDPVPIRTRRPEIPEALAAVVHQSLAKEPTNRFKDVGAMRATLESFGRTR
jgi:eukaryotic-like serine/threonine-protein kinase